MYAAIILIAIGIFLIYVGIDFFIQGADFNKFGQKWLKKTLWIWLPVYGFFRLTKEIFFQKKK